jgi:hypothetical protein
MALGRNTYRNKPKSEKKNRDGWMNFDFNFDNGLALKLLPYIMYVLFFGIIYIANRHYTERNVRKISKIRKEVDDLRIDYTTLKSDYMNATKHSEVLKKVKSLGLSESKDPNTIITKK